MRADDKQWQGMFSYLSPETRVPQDHPLRPIRKMVNQALAELSGGYDGSASMGCAWAPGQEEGCFSHYCGTVAL